MADNLLTVEDLKVYYPVKVKGGGLLRRETKYVKAVDGITFDVERGKTFGIVGESGCGKSTAGKAIVKLVEPTAGRVLFEGRDIYNLPKDLVSEYKKKIQIIFQDPYSSLDPRFTVRRIIEEPLAVHGISDAAGRRETVLKLMDDVGIRPEFINRYPHEFSGGQRQRIGVARALALNPSLIVCDEPVSALDVSIQAQILNLMADLQEKYSLTYIFISHNISVIKHFCDRVAVMYLGRIMETADKGQLFSAPKHPYTEALMAAIPVPDPDRKMPEATLQGDVPSPIDPPSGCRFHTRCKKAFARCSCEPPELKDIGDGHMVACHLYD